MFLEETGNCHSSKDRRGQGQISVDGCSVLTITVVCNGRVKTGPEHPQEESTWARNGKIDSRQATAKCVPMTFGQTKLLDTFSLTFLLLPFPIAP